MELVLRIIGIITPVLVISAMGYAYGRFRRPDMSGSTAYRPTCSSRC